MTFPCHATAPIRRTLLSSISLALILMASACSSSGGNNSNNSNQFGFVSSTSGSVVDQGQSVIVTVNQSANWTLQPAFGTPHGTNIGSLSAAAGSESATYTACAPSNTITCIPYQQVIITATSTVDSTQSAAITISIPPPPTIATSSPITVDCSLIPPGTVVLGFGTEQYVFFFSAAAGHVHFYVHLTWLRTYAFYL